MQKAVLVSVVCALGLGLLPSRAEAHGMNPNRAIIRIVDDTVYLVATPSVAAFPFVDEDKNGTLSRQEVRKFKNSILHQLGPKYLSVNPVDEKGRLVRARTLKDLFQDVSIPHLHGAAEAGYLRVERRWKLDRPFGPRVRVQWRGARSKAPLEVTVFPAAQAQAIQDQKPLAAPQTANLTRMAPGHVFDFVGTKKPALPAPSGTTDEDPSPHSPQTESAGLSPGLRQFGLLVSLLLMVLGLAEWRRR